MEIAVSEQETMNSADVEDLVLPMTVEDMQSRCSTKDALADRRFRKVEKSRAPIKTSESKRTVVNIS